MQHPQSSARTAQKKKQQMTLHRHAQPAPQADFKIRILRLSMGAKRATKGGLRRVRQTAARIVNRENSKSSTLQPSGSAKRAGQDKSQSLRKSRVLVVRLASTNNLLSQFNTPAKHAQQANTRQIPPKSASNVRRANSKSSTLQPSGTVSFAKKVKLSKAKLFHVLIAPRDYTKNRMTRLLSSAIPVRKEQRRRMPRDAVKLANTANSKNWILRPSINAKVAGKGAMQRI